MATDRIPVEAQALSRLTSAHPPDFKTAGEQVDAHGLESTLRRNIEGEVRFDAGSKAMYAVDGGNYRQVPIGVVVPRHREDVVRAVEVCRQFGAPVLSRGGGTSLCGQCCNIAVVIDWSKYANRILELNPYEKYARVEPGVICDELRNAAAPHNLTWGPDPATHTHCTFGGMLGNNSCGAHAQMAGKAADNTEEMDILLYDGTRMTVGWMDNLQLEYEVRKGGRTGAIYRNLASLRDHYAGLVEKNYPRIPRRVSGYNLDQLIPGADGRFNVARALVGSEGTCVTILEAKVRLIPARAQRVIVVLGYPNIYQASDHLMDILEFDPIALEGMDGLLISNLQKKGGPHRHFIRLLPEGKGWLMVEFGADRQQDAVDQAQRLIERLKSKPDAPNIKFYEDERSREDVWTLRESGLGATAFVPGEPITWEGWEDSAVAPEKVGAYLRDLCKLYEKYGYIGALYGHFGQGCIHTRITFDLMSERGIKTYRAFMEDATTLVTNYNGSLSGEHGDGQSKAEFLYKMFGPELIEAFREFKSIWDPDWKMNPGKVVDPWRIDQNLRLGAGYAPWEPPTHFKYPEDHGSFAHAALRCVGVGKCRRKEGKSDDNTMCPSYMVTLEERHTTRGRAHHLFEMVKNGGGVITKGWRDDAVKESLDLCLACKGCKGDCPVNVDMATYKAEFLSHYWEGRLRPRYAYAFGLIDKWARLASLAPGFINLFTQLPGLSAVAKLAAGMPQQRTIPAFAPQSFIAWWRKRQPVNQGQPRVMLWPDTFNNYFFPETAQAAVAVLEHAGYQVLVPEQHVCCGRPLYDYGFLDMARSYLEHDLRVVKPYLDDEIPVVALEPSCCSVFRDELNTMMPDRADARRLAGNTFTLSEFLTKKAPDYRPLKLHRKAIVQGHCHHKAIMRLGDEQDVMDRMSLDYTVLNSGCCGMAGSFGYEKDKYEVSIACGEHALLPEVRKAGLSTVIVADGFSCKEQIAQQTNREALHLAEVIKLAIDDGPFGPRGIYPEKRIAEARKRAQKRSLLTAGLVTVAVLGSAIAGALWLRQRT